MRAVLAVFVGSGCASCRSRVARDAHSRLTRWLFRRFFIVATAAFSSGTIAFTNRYVALDLAQRSGRSIPDGGVISAGVDRELDEFRELSRNSKAVLAQIEQRERERTGIASLKLIGTRDRTMLSLGQPADSFFPL